MATHYAVVNVLKYDNGELQFSDDDGTFKKVTPTSVTGEPIMGNLMVWVAGPGIDFISDIALKDSADAQYFQGKVTPRYGGGIWVARLKPDMEPPNQNIKYSISFKPVGEEIQIVDPELNPKQGQS